MKTFRANQLQPDDPVWVWDGSWLPAVVAEVIHELYRKFLIVRFDNSGSAPALWEEVETRNPDAHGADRPRVRGRRRRLRHAA